ncbi:hypothetical protein KXX06_007810, partial [Aspergillus fumigatus]
MSSGLVFLRRRHPVYGWRRLLGSPRIGPWPSNQQMHKQTLQFQNRSSRYENAKFAVSR